MDGNKLSWRVLAAEPLAVNWMFLKVSLSLSGSRGERSSTRQPRGHGSALGTHSFVLSDGEEKRRGNLETLTDPEENWKN